jgi:hypothetical protein
MSTTTLHGHAVSVNLRMHETLGGHTIAFHVARPDGWLQQRLMGDPTVPAASSFTDLVTAERAVNQTIQAHIAAFSGWLVATQMQREFDHDAGYPVGRIFVRTAQGVIIGPSPSTRVRVIVRTPSSFGPRFLSREDVMDGPIGKFPHLDHFLNAYMHQDWKLFGDSLESVVRGYAVDTSPHDVRQLKAEIDQFIASEGDNIEPDFHRLYPNSVLPSGWGMTAEQWLREVAKLAG